MASEATMPFVSGLPLLVVGVACDVGGVWDPEVVVVVGDLESASGVMVDWEEDREKVLARGARWVSLSSISCQPSIHSEWPLPILIQGVRTLRQFPRHLGIYFQLLSFVAVFAFRESLCGCDGDPHARLSSVKIRLLQQ